MRCVTFAGCLALAGRAVLSYAETLAVHPAEDLLPAGGPGQHLAVVVPVYRGDLSRAVSSLDRWPSTCSPLTERNADLVLYYAEGEEDAPTVTAAVETVEKTAGRCFAQTRLVYAHLSAEEDVYPKGPSVMFFKMFLDKGIQSELSQYDALALVEWDVLVASDRSFEELHHAAFRVNEDFWVKGSNLGGTNFHSTAQESGMWNMLGHINGNAIYNNNDPAFVEYVDYTRTRWQYTHPYDVALWLTISDFPYAWPLWQRYSSKFVTTNLISYVGFEHVDHTTVSNAVAGQTLFIHGSRVDEGNLASLNATKHQRNQHSSSIYSRPEDGGTPRAACNAACGSTDTAGLPAGAATVCDDTCADNLGRFGGFLCGAGDSERFGYMCRLCYVDVEEARREEQLLAQARSDVEGEQEAAHVIMCDTMRPPEAAECSDKCGRKKDTVCDQSCGTGRHGNYNCNWRDHGPKCRFCFNDVDTALMADNVALRRGGRVIMCSTLEPPQSQQPLVREVVQKNLPRPRRTKKRRKLQAWKENAKWQTTKKWEGDADNDVLAKWQKGTGDDDLPKWQRETKWANADDDEPKWKTTDKWRNNFCDEDDCPAAFNSGLAGRVCDESCSDGDPYGTNGCGASDGAFGDYCRYCYYDRDKALENNNVDDPAIMCDTLMPVIVYETVRRRATTVTESAPSIGRKLKAWRNSTSVDGSVRDKPRDKRKRKHRKLQAWRENAKWRTTSKWAGDADNDELAKWQTGTGDDDTPKWQRNQKWANVNDDEEPKWRTNQKWRNNFCDEDDCPAAFNSGLAGRVCDESCSDGVPYGTNGCVASDGEFGDYCRYCYYDRDTALENNDVDDPAIMCDTLLPVNIYETTSRRLSTSVKEGETLNFAGGETEDIQSIFAGATVLPYVNNLVRGNMCAFVGGQSNKVEQVEVAVMSVLQFLPGMTVAVAVENDGFDAYERAVGGLPGVTVHVTEDPFTASLFADELCGVDTSLIFYMQPGSILSRQFTSKDTHSTHGDLLVVHGSAKLRRVDRELAKLTTKVLGFETPSFTFNTDLFLPVGANADLRNWFVSGRDVNYQERPGDWGLREVMDELTTIRDMSAVPQVMAALAYSNNTPGVWFIDPQTWVSDHLFRTASIWEIPLVKPRYTCSIDQSALQFDAENMNAGLILQSNLDFFTHGGTCDGGYVDIRLGG